MLGSPLVRAIVAVAVLLLLLVPLRSFTAQRDPAKTGAHPEAAEKPAHLEITSTKSPFHFSVSHLGKTIWQGDCEGATATTDMPLQIPKEGIELAVQINWQGTGTAAAKLSVSLDDNEPIERTVWGDGQAANVLQFP
ncbi:MAG: hypothetical protein ACREKL_02725 [Chthoniobacterales bacterium]